MPKLIGGFSTLKTSKKLNIYPILSYGFRVTRSYPVSVIPKPFKNGYKFIRHFLLVYVLKAVAPILALTNLPSVILLLSKA